MEDLVFPSIRFRASVAAFSVRADVCVPAHEGTQLERWSSFMIAIAARRRGVQIHRFLHDQPDNFSDGIIDHKLAFTMASNPQKAGTA